MSCRAFKLATLSAILFATSAAVAQTSASPFYLAGSLGASQSSGSYSDQVRSNGPINTDYTFARANRGGGNDVAGRLAAGYTFMPNAALELGYTNFGSHEVSYQFEKTAGLIPTKPFYTGVGNFKLDGITLDVVGSAPINSLFSFNARVGVLFSNLRYGETTVVTTGTPESFSQTERQTLLHFGIGGSYQVSKPLAVTLDFMRVQNAGNRFGWTEGRNGRLSYGIATVGARYAF